MSFLQSLRKIEMDAYQSCQEKILSLLEKDSNIRLLDVGCGEGNFSVKLGEACGTTKVFGFDIDRKMVRQARRKGIRAKVGDANKRFPFASNFFDVAVANQVVEHLFNPDNFFKELYRVLKPGGYCIISTPNLCSLHNRFFVLMGWQITNIAPSTKFVFGNPNRGAASNMYGCHRHLTVFSPGTLREMCEFYGLKVEKLTGSGFHPFKRQFSKVFSEIFPTFSVFLILKAKKPF